MDIIEADTIPWLTSDACHVVSCDICEYMKNGPEPNNGEGYFPYIFHSSCNQCSSRQHAEKLTLCSFCSHLRLYHLLDCSATGVDLYEDICLNMLTLATVRERQSYCQLCRLFAIVIENSAGSYDVIKPHTPVAMTVILRQGRPGLFHYFDNNLDYGEDMLDVYPLQADVETGEGSPVPRYANSQGQAFLVTPDSLGTFVDWQKLCSWFSPASARDSLKGNIFWDFRGLKLVDVTHDELIEAESPSPFFALSYVFGGVKGAIVKREAVSSSGKISRHRLPATIRDVITVCARVGVRYLWVDQLCIDQEDQDHLQQQLDQMVLNRPYAPLLPLTERMLSLVFLE
ncbi:hypothetical protein BDV33DRAFT_201909 [Aspergillus novoparasiticus]|uniref:Heterokaryon incompatibility domain-containing protein n=1 Tax=Aspergillus novoparasiticus TaxID=986946 RepID=A0A5N6EWK0_9EURO|nr:hypothetical protein BDV33DRAFT_201909 [Aspergillus novoparasiticus]